jgi:hypothetical protein
MCCPSWLPSPSQILAGHRSRHRRVLIQRPHLAVKRLECMTIPSISTAGTRPMFYLVPVTFELSTAVMAGSYPRCETMVSMCVTVAGQRWDGCLGVPARWLGRLPCAQGVSEKAWSAVLDGILPVVGLLVRCAQS